MLKVFADVVDITTDKPKSTDKFLVDTNVWIWFGYSNAKQGSYNQHIYYPNYLKQALSEKSAIYRCSLSFSEIAHVIETTEFELFKKIQGNSNVSRKEFRHYYPIERRAVVSEVENTWLLVKQVTGNNIINLMIDDIAVEEALMNIQNQELDGYDLFIMNAATAKGIDQIITDDGDFGQVNGIQVFTSNGNLIREAKKQGRLIKR